MNRAALERHQAWLYLAGIVAGLIFGRAAPALAPALDALVWPVLVLLLYATFVQVPVLRLRAALADRRFAAATLVGQFLLIPALVAGLLGLLPDDPAIRLGAALVLLAPCTDWFITFCRLGGGDAARAVAISPLNLVLQLLLLPVWLWWLLPAGGPAPAIAPAALLAAGLALIGLPLLGAVLSERWFDAAPERSASRERLADATVPLLALVVFLIAGAQADAALAVPALLATVLPVFVAYLVAAAVLAKLLALAFRLPPRSGRTLAFGLGTRNSFVVLPFALALPAGWEAAALVIVLQSLVELFGMVAYLAWLPRWLFPIPSRGGYRR